MPELQFPTFRELPESVQVFIHQLVSRVTPEKVILFGSRARGSARTNSDYDVAVVFESSCEEAFNRFLVDMETEPLTLVKIDLVDLKRLGPDYQQNIAREGKVIYG